MTEVRDGAQSRQKAEYVNHSVIKRGKSDYIELTYKRLDGDNSGTEMKAGAFIGQLDEESKERIKAKGEFVVVKTKQGNFWNLTKVDDVSTFTEKVKTTGNYGGGTRTSNSTFNTAGIKVGAVLHDAVALAGQGATVAQVKTLAEQLLALSYELEQNVADGKYTTKKSETTIKATKTTDEAISTDLSNINF